MDQEVPAMVISVLAYEYGGKLITRCSIRPEPLFNERATWYHIGEVRSDLPEHWDDMDCVEALAEALFDQAAAVHDQAAVIGATIKDLL